MRKLAGEFTIAKWEEKSFQNVEAPAKANVAEIIYNVSGDLTGTLTGKYILIYQDDKKASYCGALQFKGNIGDLRGTLFVQELGDFCNGIANTNWTILGGSGTKDFTDILGSGNYSATTDGAASFELNIQELG